MRKSLALPAASTHCESASSDCKPSYKRTVIYTTFVETDTNNFRELVQKLTGVSDGKKVSVTMPAINSQKSSRVRGIEVGPQKSAFKIRNRRQFPKRLAIKAGHNQDDPRILSGGKNHGFSPTLIPSPITPLGPADPFTTSSRNCCYSSTPTSCNQSSEQEKEFYFQDSAISVKREPELLLLFPLHSPTQPNT